MHMVGRIKSSLNNLPLTGYIFANLAGLGFVIGAFAFHSLLQPLIGEEAPFFLFYMAIIAVVWRGGLWAGLVVTLGAAILHFYTFSSIYDISSHDVISLISFMLEGMLISVLVYRLRVNQQQVATHQGRLRLALEVANISLYTNDRDLKYTWISHIHPKFGPSDIIGKRDDEVLPEASVSELIALKQEVITTGQRRQKYIHSTIYDEDFSFFVTVDPIVTSTNRISGVTVAAVDVTHATRLQIALEDQRLFTDTMLQALPAVVYILDIQKMQNRFVSPYVKDCLGYMPDEIVANESTFFSSLIHPDDQLKLSEQFAALRELEGKQVITIEYRMRHKNGEWRWFFAQHTIFHHDHQGAVLEILGVAQEITDRKKTEQALQESEEKFRVALKSTSIIIAQVDRDLRYTWIHNPHPTFNPTSSLGKRDDELNPGDGSQQLLALKRRVLETNQSSHQRIVFELPEGARTYVVTAEPLMDSSGAVTGVTTAALDITEHERIQSQLRESETLRLLALEAAGMGIWVNHVDETSVWWDAQARHIFGVTPNEAVSLDKGFSIIHPDDRPLAQEAYAQAIAPSSFGKYAVEKRIVWPDGSVRWVSTKGKVLFEDTAGVRKPSQFVGTVVDITEQKQVEIQLKESLEQLQLAKDAAKLSVYDYDIPGDSIEWDNRLRELWGIGPDEHINYRTFMEGIHPEDRESVQAAIDQSLKPDGDGYYFAEYRIVQRITGDVRWISAIGKTYFENKQPIRLIGIVQDITREKSLQIELETTLAQFEHMTNAMPQLVWTANDQSEVDYYNNRISDFDGISQNDDGTWAYQPVLHPEDVEPTLAAWQHAVDHNEPYEFEHRVRMADGSYRWHISRAISEKSFTGAKKWYGTATDIHDLKQAQQSLRESEARFRNMADNAPMMVWVTEAGGSCTYLSKSWYSFTGQTPETGLGFGWLEATHPEDRERAHQVFTRANQRQEAFSIDYRLRHKDGEYRWAIDAARPRFSEDGEFVGYIGSVIDITERKRAEDTLRASEEKYRTLFNSIDAGFCICELLVDESDRPYDYRFLETNPMFEPHTGLKDASGKTALELVPTLEQHWMEIYGNVALTGEAVRFRQGSDAMGRWFDVYSFRMGDPEKRQFAILFTDITERKQAEEVLQQQRAILQQLVDSLPVMITLYEPDGHMLYLNNEFERLTGWNSETASNVDFATEVYPDLEHRNTMHEYLKSLEPGWREVKIITRDGRIIDSSWTNIRLADDRLVGIGIDIRERLRQERHNQVLRTVAVALSSALKPQEVTEIILQRAIAQTEAFAGTIAILSPEKPQLEIVGTYGYPDQIVDKWRTIPIDHPTAPIALAVREERTLWMGSPEEREQIIPATPGLKPEEQHQAWAVLPFNIDNQLRGVFALGFNTPQIFDETEQAFLLTLTSTCAQALARAYLSEKLQKTAAVEERHRLARDLHDAVKQMLFASSTMSETLPRMIERKPERARELSLEISRLNRAALAEMQILLQTMRPEILIATPFKSLLENLCKKLEGMKQIETNLYWNGPNDLYLPEEVHTTLYRLAQEAFNNITKHSEATQVKVHGDWNENNFDLEIHDNGQGFDLKRTSIGLGMNTMRERAVSVGAEFTIESAPGAGTSLRIKWQGETN